MLITRLNKREFQSLLPDIIQFVSTCGLDTAHLHKAEKAFIGTLGSVIVCYVGTETCWLTGNVHLQSLCTRKGYRKRGYGSRMVRVVQAECPKLYALTLFWNNQFYYRLGFQRIDPSIKKGDTIAGRPKHLYCTALKWEAK